MNQNNITYIKRVINTELRINTKTKTNTKTNIITNIPIFKNITLLINNLNNNNILLPNQNSFRIFNKFSYDKTKINKLTKTNKVYTLLRFNFCEKINSKENETNNEKESEDLYKKRYEYDYESPQDSNYEYKSKMKRFFNLIISILLFSYGFYYFFLQKMNLLTKKMELYFINEYFELKLTNYFSKKIQIIFGDYIFNHQYKDINFVLNVYKNLLKKNKIPYENIKKENIFIIQSESLGCLLLKNGDLFITNRLIDFCKENKNYLGMFISSELAYQAMGLNTHRILKIWFEKKKENSKHLKKSLYQTDYLPSYSLMDKRQRQLEYFNKYLLFYPESIILTYFEEKEILKVALKILNKAEYDIIEVIKFLFILFVFIVFIVFIVL
jgi:hypothetical protein